MTIAAWKSVLVRDLQGARAQLAAYDVDAQVWALPPGLSNSAGTLALHLAGNLQHFVGAELGDTGYVRDRDAEFNARDLSRPELDARLAAAVETVDRTLSALAPGRLEGAFTIAGVELPTRVALAHLAAHLAYHLGQMDYHRRVVTGRADAAGMVSVKALLG